MQVAIAHLVVINTWGTINSFGVFQSYYKTLLSRPPSNISWIGSMQVFFLFVSGVLTGRLMDAGYFRIVFAIGSFLMVLGGFMASISTTYWQLFLSQGLCAGLGMGCLFCPVVAILSTYFLRYCNQRILYRRCYVPRYGSRAPDSDRLCMDDAKPRVSAACKPPSCQRLCQTKTLT